MVSEKIGVTIDRYRSLLNPNPDYPDDREFSTERFRVPENIQAGTSVLVIDDTLRRVRGCRAPHPR